MDSVADPGPFLLTSLLADVPISAEEPRVNDHITCVEFWNGNLYIGTSASEVLHYVLLPPDPESDDDKPNFVPGYRLQPALPDAHAAARGSLGVQQILLLPDDGKACILSDGFLSFYNLPELSPTFESSKPISCNFIGAVDENEGDVDPQAGTTVMLGLRSRIRMVKIGDGPKRVRDIVLDGCIAAARRDNIACIADSQSYSLLDVVEQQQIPLLPISNAADEPEDGSSLQAIGESAHATSYEEGHPTSVTVQTSHERNASLDTASGDTTSDLLQHSRPLSPGTEDAQQIKSVQYDEKASDRPPQTHRHEKSALQASRSRPTAPLRPHILSPSGSEFLYTTGATPDEPGVGMFVNLEGDPSRGTIEFDRYPEELVIDGGGDDATTGSTPGQTSQEGYILAVMKKHIDGENKRGIEIQRWDLEAGDGQPRKHWLKLPPWQSTESDESDIPVGMRSTVSPSEIFISQLTSILALRELRPDLLGHSEGIMTPTDTEKKGIRERTESDDVKRLSLASTRTIVWRRNHIWLAVRNPLPLRLDEQLPSETTNAWQGAIRVKNLRSVEHVMSTIREQEPQTELEFIGLKYARQKASLLLFMDTLKRSSSGGALSDVEEKMTGQALAEGEIDPRIILALMPLLRHEVLPGKDGIWLFNGLRSLVEDFLKHTQSTHASQNNISLTHSQLIKNYLIVWRKKKGYGSVTSEKEVFMSVDAALLHLLLIMDSPNNPQGSESARGMLHALAEDGVDCFDRAVALLEQFKRLYVLSILYQSRFMSRQVLETWRRMLEGEPDAAGEFSNGEYRMRKYLVKIKDSSLVEEYAIWLANRNPALGVQVFADETSKVKFEHRRIVQILRKDAPGAVKDYLEHLVFGKNLAQYANDLIGYYLNSVLMELRTSERSRTALLQSYETYRALRPPKPTYSQFVEDNAVDAEWWRNRSRLLHLLGGSHGSASQYDVPGILEQLEQYEHELVPEMIVLEGRQGRHSEALRLLTHGLGDYDTAIRYCLVGGASVYSPIDMSSTAAAQPHATLRDQRALFRHLLEEFFSIDDESDRITQTSELIGRYPTWFDAEDVLALIPEHWSVEIVSRFLESAFRALVTERHETAMTRALVSVENLNANIHVIEKMDALGPQIAESEQAES